MLWKIILLPAIIASVWTLIWFSLGVKSGRSDIRILMYKLQARIDAAVEEDALGGVSNSCLMEWDHIHRKRIPACGICDTCLAKKAYEILTGETEKEKK